MGKCAGKRVLITGGSRGIGRATAQIFVDEGADVIVTGTKPDGSGPEGTTYICVDFSDPAATKAFCDELPGLDVDVLVNNAGINIPGALEDLSQDDIERIHRINVFAPMATCRAVIPGMKKKGCGHIVNVSSMWGLVGRKERSIYSATKFSLDGFSASLAAEVAPHNILVNCVAPGFTRTEILEVSFTEEQIENLANTIPLGRLGKPEEVGKLIVFLGSNDNSYITGQNIAIEGGFTKAR